MPHIGHSRRPVHSFQSGGFSLIRPERDSSRESSTDHSGPGGSRGASPSSTARPWRTAVEHDLKREADARFPDPAPGPATPRRRFDRYWGSRRFKQWLAGSPVGQRIRAILRGRSAANRDSPRSGDGWWSTIDLTTISAGSSTCSGRAIHGPVEVHIAGSIPTLIKGLDGPTDRLTSISWTRFPRRCSPAAATSYERSKPISVSSWATCSPTISRFTGRDRRQWLGDFGGLRVYVVDEYDIFVSKLSSKKEKHQSDLGVLALKLDKEIARRRLFTDGRSFLDDPKLRPQIEENWRFIFQEPLIVTSMNILGSRTVVWCEKRRIYVSMFGVTAMFASDIDLPSKTQSVRVVRLCTLVP